MKARTFITAIGAMAMLSACATAPTHERKPTSQVDQAYINAVERQASRVGVQVYWVNPPRRHRTERANREQ